MIFIFIVLIVMNLGLLWGVARVTKNRSDGLSSSYLFVFFCSVYFVLYPFIGLFVRGEYSEKDLVIFTLVSVSLLFFLIGVFSLRSLTRAEKILIKVDVRSNFLALSPLLFSFFLTWYAIAVEFGGVVNYVLLPYPVRISRENLPIELAIMFFSVGSASTIITYLLAGKYRFSFFLTIIVGGAFLIIGKRMPILIPLLSLVFLMLERGYLARKVFYVFGLFIFLGGIAYGYLRNFIGCLLSGRNVDFYSIISSVDLTKSEFSYQYNNFKIVLDNYHSFMYGESLLRAFLFLVPGSLIDRGETLSESFAREFFPDLFSIGGGMGFSLLSELYINFYYFFPFFFFFLGLIYLIFDLWFKCSCKAVKYYIYLPLLSTLCLIIQRTEAAAVLKNIEIITVYSLFFYFWHRLNFSKIVVLRN